MIDSHENTIWASVLILENFLYGEKQKQFSKQKCVKCSQQMNKKVKTNPKIPPVGVIDDRFKV